MEEGNSDQKYKDNIFLFTINSFLLTLKILNIIVIKKINKKRTYPGKDI